MPEPVPTTATDDPDNGSLGAGVSTPRIPLTVLAGYLGAGKTTRLNRLLAEPAGLRFGVLVNDFGAVNIDASLIDNADDRTIGLANGCVCCTIADDLGGALDRLAALSPRLDHVVLEASGVADPDRLARWARTWPGFRLAGCTVVADASRVRAQADDVYVGATVRRQLAGADRVLLSRFDEIDAAATAAVEAWLGGVAPGAACLRSSLSDSPRDLLGRDERGDRGPLPTEPEPRHGHRAVTFATDDPIDPGALRRFLAAPPASLVRLKGWMQRSDRPGRAWTVQFSSGDWTVTPARRPGNPATTLVAIWADPGTDAVAMRETLASLRAG